MVGLLAVLCVIALFLITNKFTDTWRLFYSKQKLINQLMESLEDGENEEGETKPDSTEKVLTIGDIDNQPVEEK